MRYWVRINKQSIGPLTPEEIAKHPEITEGSLVCPEDKTKSGDWVRLRTVPALMALCARVVPPPLRSPGPSTRPVDERQPPAARPVPPPFPPAPPSSSGPRSQPPPLSANEYPLDRVVASPPTRYWVLVDRQRMGPFTPQEIRQSPVVDEGTMVQPEDKTGPEGWVRLSQVPELIALYAQRSSRPTYRCASCKREYSNKDFWEKHRLNCEKLTWAQETRPTSQAALAAQVAPVAGGLSALLIALLFLGWLWYSWRLTQPPNLSLPEIAYRGKTGDFVDCHDFAWRDGGELTFKVRFRKEFAFGSFRLGYELRDQSGSVLIDSGGVGSWDGSRGPGTSYEKSIYLGRDKSSRTRKIIFYSESESPFPGLFPGVTRH